MLILIVDDSLSMRRIVKKFIENSGFHNVMEAGDGIEALDIVQKQKTIDLIISDLNMPNMNGLEFLKIVKEDSRTKDIPFIMLTVEAIQRTMNKAIALGVDSYIVKPIAEKVFINEMLRVIRFKNEV
ncbi:MAG: response regulator [Proteobacteria bacterium]|nr:response regulator [Pseudomonadota bacterium]MBU1581459.1 response regulator [Pseudomonadota bacterium]MBU2454332.1 response regulator [Pseudomonadota bacterium]MBU2627324.1 response regulator [Pseudomonadota bacterium]